MNILITGGNGFIGSALATGLTQKKHTVFKYDRSIFGNLEDMNYMNLSRFLQENNIEHVFHCAANPNVSQYDLKVMHDAILGTNNLIQAVLHSNVKFFDFASTVLVANISPKRPGFNINNYYALSKLCNERNIIQASQIKQNLHTNIFRYCATTGKNATHGAVIDIYNKIIKAIENNETLVNLKNNMYKPYIHIDYLVKSTIRRIHSYSSKLYTISSSDSISIENIFYDLLTLISDYRNQKYNIKNAFNTVDLFSDYSIYNVKNCSIRYSAHKAIDSFFAEMIK